MKAKESAMGFDSSDSSDDVPLRASALPARKSAINRSKVSKKKKTGASDSSSSSSDSEPRRKKAGSRVVRRRNQSDSDSSSSEDEKPTRRAPIKPRVPDSDSSDSEAKAKVKKRKPPLRASAPRQVTSPTDDSSESSSEMIFSKLYS